MDRANGEPIVGADGAEVSEAVDNQSAFGNQDDDDRTDHAPPVQQVPGPYRIATADSDGKALDPPNRFAPETHEAVNIYFGLVGPAPTPEQSELQDQIAQVLKTGKELYLSANGEQKEPFRLLYTRLFRVAQVGLEGENTKPDVARITLARVIDDLLCSEGPRVKNAHLRRLGKSAAFLCAICVALYAIFTFAGEGSIFVALGISPPIARCFVALWMGSFLGVWLSYAIRKAEFQLRDLTVSEADFIEPAIRLIFSGMLANIAALFLLLGIVDIRLGSLEIANFASEPTIALLLGIVLGINELLLPASIAGKSRDLVGKLP